MNRREFLQISISAAAALAAEKVKGAIAPYKPYLEAENNGSGNKRKLIIILFGGGTRYSETFGDKDKRYIPYMWKEIVPKGALFTNMRVEHKVVHPNSAGAIMTGFWEWDDLDWTVPVRHPTIFEIYRKSAQAPDTKTWAFVYASILAQTGQSIAQDYGSRFAANVALPPTIPRSAAEQMNLLMTEASATGSIDAQISAGKKCEELAKSSSRISLEGLRCLQARSFIEEQYEQWKGGNGTTSHDAFLAEGAINCMKKFSPDVMSIDFGEIDCAHYGNWSRYVEAITRTDELTGKIWRAAYELQDYKDKTLFLILPDHGRELERPGGSGFIHHSNFYTNEDADEGCRRVWMLAAGPGIKAGLQIEKPAPITAAAATGLEFLGLNHSSKAEKSVLSLII